jgi:hypothetical protein
MSDRKEEAASGKAAGGARSDTKSDVQQELRRESTEGRDAIGDVAANRNLSGSSTWETLPEGTEKNASGGPGDLDVTTQAVPREVEPGDEERRHVADQIAGRLRGRGVRLDGRESGEQLVTLLESVERFEAVVQSRGGDLMVDEPVGAGAPLSPDVRAFVLPARGEKESIMDFIGRIAEATARARHAGTAD